jgi:hypothetical protein
MVRLAGVASSQLPRRWPRAADGGTRARWGVLPGDPPRRPPIECRISPSPQPRPGLVAATICASWPSRPTDASSARSSGYSVRPLANAVVNPRARWRVRRSAAGRGRPAVFVSRLWPQPFAVCSTPALQPPTVRSASSKCRQSGSGGAGDRGRHTDAGVRSDPQQCSKRGQLKTLLTRYWRVRTVSGIADIPTRRGPGRVRPRDRRAMRRFRRALMALSWLGRAALDNLDPIEAK